MECAGGETNSFSRMNSLSFTSNGHLSLEVGNIILSCLAGSDKKWLTRVQPQCMLTTELWAEYIFFSHNEPFLIFNLGSPGCIRDDVLGGGVGCL